MKIYFGEAKKISTFAVPKQTGQKIKKAESDFRFTTTEKVHHVYMVNK